MSNSKVKSEKFLAVVIYVESVTHIWTPSPEREREREREREVQVLQKKIMVKGYESDHQLTQSTFCTSQPFIVRRDAYTLKWNLHFCSLKKEHLILWLKIMHVWRWSIYSIFKHTLFSPVIHSPFIFPGKLKKRSSGYL